MASWIQSKTGGKASSTSEHLRRHGRCKLNEITYYARFGYCDDGICISFPDLPGACSCGFTRDEALGMAKKALEICLDVSEGDDVEIRPPSCLEELKIQADGKLEEYENSFEFVLITAGGEGLRNDNAECRHGKFKSPSGKIVMVPNHESDMMLPEGMKGHLSK